MRKKRISVLDFCKFCGGGIEVVDQWIAPNYLLYFQIITTESTAAILAEVNLKNLRIFRNTVHCA